ncbi:MAG: CusA/CzcA family heavy metal efflux RND transporter [Spirosomataceae bacterium]
MIDSLILFSIRNKLIVGLFVLVLVSWGGYSLSQLPVDAVPDITTNQIQILTQSPTLAAQEVEQFVTTPLELAMANIPDVVEFRSVSKQGLSVITIVFKDEADILRAKQWVAEQIKSVESAIPPEFGAPGIAPLTTGLGEIYQYTLVPKKGYEHRYNLMQLRTIQDWIVKRQLAGIPGVIEISSFGGFVKQYEVSVNPERLRAMGVTITELFDALAQNNGNTGGSYIEKSDQAFFIRGEGTVKQIGDIEQIVIRNRNGIPLLVKDVATVKFGTANRFGALTRNGENECVGGIVLMLKGANSAETVNRVKERVARIQKNLPEGIEIQPFIERTKLINKTITTVTENLILGGLIVVFVLVLLMGSLRAGLIAASVIPLAMLFTIGMMTTFGISANLMSLGAIDFGVIVDGAVIIVEALVHRFQVWSEQNRKDEVETQAEVDSLVYQTASTIRQSAAFGEIIILIVYLPILSLVGIEGKMFRPMALTVGFAILGAFVLSLTYVPMISSVFLGKKLNAHLKISEQILHGLYRVYEPAMRWAWRWQKTTIAVSVVLFTASLLVFGQLGGEFIPTLDEGDLAIDLRTPPGTSLSKTVEEILKAQKSLRQHFPEIQQIVGRIGASEIPTDPMPIEMTDQMINMKDISEWKNAKNRDEMSEKMTEVIDKEVPGLSVEFTQPIQMRFNEMITGVRSDVVVKIYGNDLDILFERANACVPHINQVEGVASVRVEQLVGLPQISIQYNRGKIAAYGLRIADLNRLVRAAFAGETAGTVFEAERRFDLVVRLDSTYRKDIENVRQLQIPLATGGGVPFSEVADIQYKAAPAQISHDDSRRRITIGIGVRGRDVESIVNDIQKVIQKNVKLPAGYYFTYGGAFENLQKAKERLSVAVPLALLLIFILLYFTFSSLTEALLIFSAVPLSAIGGVLALWARDMPFSISAGVGFIALFGVAVLNGIVLISYLNQLEKEGVTDLKERVFRAVQVRFRPVVMTATVASLGFLPMAISSSGGAEVQRPLATVVIGGILSATLLTLVVLPVLYALIHRRKAIKGGPTLTIVTLLLLASMSVQAQPPISLKQAIDIAVQRNGNLKSTQLEINSQRSLLPTAYELPKASFDLQLGQTQAQPADYTLMGMQAFSPTSVYRTQEKYLQGQLLVTEKRLGLERNELIGSVKQQYYQLLYLYQLRQLLRSQDTLYFNALKAARLRYQTGETNRLEEVSADTRWQQIRNRLALTQTDLQLAQRSLQRFLFTKETIGIDTTVSLLRSAPGVLLADSISEQNPLLSLLKQQTQTLRLQTDVARSQLKPDWRVGVANQSIEKRAGYAYVMAGLSIPIFTKGQKARIEASKINEQLGENQYQTASFQLENEVATLRLELDKLSASLRYYTQSALPQTEVLSQTAWKSFKAGDIDYVTFFQNVQQVAQIREDYLRTQLSFSLTVIALEKLLGVE